MKRPTLPSKRRALAGRRTPELPLRAEFFSSEQLVRHAVFLASSHKVAALQGPDVLLDSLDQNEMVLRAFQQETGTRGQSARLTPAMEWVLDNFYLIEEQIQLARRHLPPGYSRLLPRLASGTSKNFPRVYDIVLELVSHLDAQVDAESLSSFVAAYQSVNNLQLGRTLGRSDYA
jgi:cyclic beta-1,2-glucan synthetase